LNSFLIKNRDRHLFINFLLRPSFLLYFKKSLKLSFKSFYKIIRSQRPGCSGLFSDPFHLIGIISKYLLLIIPSLGDMVRVPRCNDSCYFWYISIICLCRSDLNENRCLSLIPIAEPAIRYYVK